MISPCPQTELSPFGDTRPKVLVVEDDADMGWLLCDRLKSQGYEALHTTSGEESLQLAAAELPDLILMDLRLPGIDGLTVCQLLAEDPDTARIPVIVVSGMESPNIIRRVRAAGSQYFLRKPYDPNALLVLIEHTIGVREVW